MSLCVSFQQVDSEILCKEILHYLNAPSSSKNIWIMVLHVTAIKRVFFHNLPTASLWHVT